MLNQNYWKPGLRFPDKKHLAFSNLVQFPKVWSVFITTSFIVLIPQVRLFFILLEFCARVDNCAKLSTICLSLNIFCDKRKLFLYLKSNLKTCPILGLLLLLSVCPLLSEFCEPNFQVKRDKQ